MINYTDTIKIGAALLSEHGENTEWDRAIASLLAELWPIKEMTTDERSDNMLAVIRDIKPIKP